MYHMNDPVPTAVAIQYAIVSVLALALVTAILRPWYRGFPFERTLWFIGGFVCTSVGTTLLSRRPPDVPGAAGLGPLFWLIALVAFLNGCFRRPRRPDQHLVSPQTGDVIAAGICLLINFNQWLPSLGHPREASYRTECRHNLTSIALGFHNGYFDEGKLPSTSEADPPHSWRVALLPYLDQKSLFKRYESSASWDAPVNLPVATTKVDVYLCPSRKEHVGVSGIVDAQQRYYSQYEMLTGPHTAGTATSFRDFTDGTSNSLLVVESCGLNRVWTDPADIDTGTVPCGINLPSPVRNLSPGWMSSHHREGAFAAFADGRVAFLAEKTDPRVLKTLATIDDGESVPEY